LCDRIALINNGEFISIDTPQNIIANFTDTLYSVEGDNMYQLLLDLRKNPLVKTCYAFGDTLHVTLKGEKEKGEGRKDSYGLTLLRSYGLKKISPTIEDCYMNLSQNVSH